MEEHTTLSDSNLDGAGWALTKNGGYITVTFPDFPGCVSGGENVSAALEAGREALNFHIGTMAEDNAPIPSESSDAELSELIKEAENHGDFCRIAIIEADIPDREPGKNQYLASSIRP